MSVAASYHQRYRPGHDIHMNSCNTWPSHTEGLPTVTSMSMNESPLPAFHINNHSNISFAPMIFPGESVMVLPAQWVFSQFNASRPNPFDAMSDILGTSFQTTPLSMVPASTMSLGLSTTPTEGTGPSVMMDSMAGYGDSARLEAQVREQDLSFNIAMATQDQRPLYFVLSYPQPSSIPHVLASPQQLLQPLQSAEKHIQDILMASDKFSTDHNTGSVDDYHLAPSGMATISPADTMNALSSALSPAMMNVNTPLPNMIDSPYLPTKDEPVDDNDYDFDDTDNNEDNINDSESDIETEDNDKEYRGKERSSSIDTIHLYGSDSHDAEQKLSPNTCSRCNKTFTRRSNLKTHEKLHERNHAVKCPTCGCSFSRQPDLNRHIMAIHQRNRAHSCGKCGRAFSRKDAWKVHESSCKQST